MTQPTPAAGLFFPVGVKGPGWLDRAPFGQQPRARPDVPRLCHSKRRKHLPSAGSDLEAGFKHVSELIAAPLRGMVRAVICNGVAW